VPNYRIRRALNRLRVGVGLFAVWWIWCVGDIAEMKGVAVANCRQGALPDLRKESGYVRLTRPRERNMESRRSSTPLVREDLDFRCSQCLVQESD